MIKPYKIKISLAAIAVTVLVSCVTKKYQPPVVKNLSQLYRDSLLTDTLSMANTPVKQLFSDTILVNLINEGLRENLDLKTAVQRINEAQATYRQSKAAYLPSLDGSIGVTQTRTSAASLDYPSSFLSLIDLNTTTYQAALSTSWEADIWGKLSSAKRSAFANLLQSDAAKRVIQTQLIADIANGYYNLLALDQELAITKQTLEIRIKDVETVKVLKEGAVVNGAAVVQSEANRYAAQVTIPDLNQSIREQENALSILLARTPGTVKRGMLNEQKPAANMQIGVPSQLLQNRPDVQQAEFAFRAAFENTNLARTYFYPQLTITGQGGLSSLQLKDFFDNSIFYNFIGGLTQPIFNKGQNKARLRTAQAQQAEAYFAFQKSLLDAGQEVTNSLYAYQNAVEKQSSRAQQIQALEKSVDYTKELLRYSSATNYTDVLTSEQGLLAAQLSGVNDRLQELQAIVNLYRALGGGWKNQ